MGCCNSRDSTIQMLTLQAHPWRKQGHRIMNTPETTVAAVMQAVKDAEELKQDPVYVMEVEQTFVKRNGKKTGMSLLDIKNILMDLYRNDQILTDEEMNRFSMQQRNQNQMLRPTQFDLCSDRLVTKFPTYELDKKCRIVPGPKTQLRNFNELKDLLLSKDLTRDNAFDRNEFQFLDGKVDMSG